MADHIPPDICREIFLRLPAKSLIRFRSVCKSWRHVIDDPIFVQAHIAINKQLSSNTILIGNSTGPPFHPFYSFDLEILKFTNGLQTIDVTPRNFSIRTSSLPVASCDGLMLIPRVRNVIWDIWNPATHERLLLPKRKFSLYVEASGIGHDHATDDYKAVVIVGRYTRAGYVFETQVYSLKLDSWRKIENIPGSDYRQCPSGPGVFLRGALHWILTHTIIVLDLETENYHQLKLTPVILRSRSAMRCLDELGGCLTVSVKKSKHFDVWVMKDYGVEESWVKLFSIKEGEIHSLGHYLRPVAYTKNEKQVFLKDDMGYYLFDLESNSVKMIRIHGISGTSSAQILPGSLYRLHDNCGVRKSVAAKRRRVRQRMATKIEMTMPDTKLIFCVKNGNSWQESHDGCYSKDLNWYNSSSEDED